MGEIEFLLQPEVYATNTSYGELGEVLDELWKLAPQDSTLYAASGFVEQGGVLPFVRTLRGHIEHGGKVKCFFGGSPSQSMASRQAVVELLGLGADVRLLNRKKIFHSKMYGVGGDVKASLVVSSGNFTGPGIALNVESSIVLRGTAFAQSGFSWDEWERALSKFAWHIPRLSTVNDSTDPAWKLTFDETHGRADAGEDAPGPEEVLAVTLSPIDVARVQSSTYKGTAYLWLSRYMTGYFPTMSVRTKPSAKTTFSADLELEFVDLGTTKTVRVTFEAYNNLDFRLGVGPLRGTGLAKAGDIALLRRVDDTHYRLKLLHQKSRLARRLDPYLIHHIGHKGKRYGMIPHRMVRKVV